MKRGDARAQAVLPQHITTRTARLFGALERNTVTVVVSCHHDLGCLLGRAGDGLLHSILDTDHVVDIIIEKANDESLLALRIRRGSTFLLHVQQRLASDVDDESQQRQRYLIDDRFLFGSSSRIM